MNSTRYYFFSLCSILGVLFFRSSLQGQVPNTTPTNILLSASSISENMPAEMLVGELTATDPDLNASLVFSLVNGNGDDHNHLFIIRGKPEQSQPTQGIIDGSQPPSNTLQDGTKQWITTVNLGSTGGFVDLFMNSGSSGDRIFLRMDGTIIFDTGEWRTSGSSANGDRDRFAVSFYPGQPTTFKFIGGLSNIAYHSFQLPLVSLSPMPSLSSQLEIVVESQDLFQANYAIFPSIGSSLRAKEPLDHEANATLQVRVRATDEHNASVEKKFTIDISDEFDDPGKWNKTLAPDRQAGDLFGSAVSQSGNLLAIGARKADPDSQADAGVAYLYRMEANGSTTFLDKALAPTGQAGDELGASVSMSGNLLAVGAVTPGAPNYTGATYSSGRRQRERFISR